MIEMTLDQKTDSVAALMYGVSAPVGAQGHDDEKVCPISVAATTPSTAMTGQGSRMQKRCESPDYTHPDFRSGNRGDTVSVLPRKEVTFSRWATTL
ncbi:hypothetical protein [Schlesneria sp. DSM 10557]|uniref:hypothetical protein n=1 Tax=Schlesneria sp. DSM 10557 TaxID=3044399 RepID=UPI0035C7C14E